MLNIYTRTHKISMVESEASTMIDHRSTTKFSNATNFPALGEEESGDEEKLLIGGKRKSAREASARIMYSSILTRLKTANPAFTWKLSTLEKCTKHYINGLNFSMKLVMVTDPYNPLYIVRGGGRHI